MMRETEQKKDTVLKTTEHTVIITCDSHGQATPSPDPLHASPGDTVQWLNECGDTRTVRFTSLWPFTPPKADIVVPAGGTSAAYTVVDVASQPSHNAYNILPLAPGGPPGGPEVIIP